MTISKAAEKARAEMTAKWKAQYAGNSLVTEPEIEEDVPTLVAGFLTTAQPPIALEADEVMYSELTGRLPTTGPDFAVQVYANSVWEEGDLAFIPKRESFTDYIVDHSILGPMLRARADDRKVLVVGPAGCGKSSINEYICALINQPFLRFNGRGDMESETILGSKTVNDGNMTFELGELPKAMLAGWYVNFDEVWSVPAPIMMSLQRMLERHGILQLDDMAGTLAEKQIVPNNKFNMVMCSNVVGTGDGASKYAATNIQDGSTLNRMDLVLKMSYLSMEDEVIMLAKMHPEIDNSFVYKMVQLARLVRTSYEQDEVSATISPRNLDTWGGMAIATESLEEGFRLTVLERFAEDSENTAIRSHWETVFGTSL